MVILKRLLSNLLRGLNRFRTYHRSINGFNNNNFSNFFRGKRLSFFKSLSFSIFLDIKIILLSIIYLLKSITKYLMSIRISFISIKDLF